MVHWRRKWQSTPIFFPEEPHGQYEKPKRYARPAPIPGWKVPYMLLGKSRGQLKIAPEGMKWLGQSRKNAQLWMLLVVKVKSDAIKNNVAENLECWVHESR